MMPRRAARAARRGLHVCAHVALASARRSRRPRPMFTAGQLAPRRSRRRQRSSTAEDRPLQSERQLRPKM